MMIPESVYRKYSQAMFDIAQESQLLDTMIADMKVVRDVLKDNEELRKFLGNPLITAEAQHIDVAKISLIKPLTAEEEKMLVTKLEQVTGNKIEPLYSIDPSIIGGVVIKIGDRVIDGSLKRQIHNMERALLQGGVVNEVTD